MASTGSRAFARQVSALTYKNLLVCVARRPLGFLFTVYAFPLAFLTLLLCIPKFLHDYNTVGVASPVPIKSLADTITGKLVIVQPPYLGPDVQHVVQAFTEPLDHQQLLFLDNQDDLPSVCLANLRGISDCHAAVTFTDSPLTQQQDHDAVTTRNHTWEYTIWADPARDDSHFDILGHDTDQENLFLPLQLAVNNAITNSTTRPEVLAFTSETQSEQDEVNLHISVLMIALTYVFALSTCYLSIVYSLTRLITAERESGMSQLVDAMGGGSAPAARVISWLLVFNSICLPCFIGLGALFGRIMFPTTSTGVLIGWQILLGLAVNSSTVFAASFFTKSRVSAIYVAGGFLLMSVAGQVYSLRYRPTTPKQDGVTLLSLLFPISNAVFFTHQMCLWEVANEPAVLDRVPPERDGLNSESYNVTQGTMLSFLVVQIVFYPILAIIVEHVVHGIAYYKRSFTPDQATHVVAETFNLKKRFVPNILELVFCCGIRRVTTAVDGVSLQSHRGQILCLVGPNGSGKTTTLHMMSGFIAATEGSVKLNALSSQIGICPQKNTLWECLTVSEHVRIWNWIKAGSETAQGIDQLIRACDLDKKRESQAKTLSGGQKRKLQLACMFVGDPSICLIDECTSGLDPLSRRVIWDMLLQQRSKRSIILTTHFLDEVDVLADYVVILSKGKVKCQGAVAQLKHLHGGGYKVHVPLSSSSEDTNNIGYTSSIHQDTRVYTTPNSSTAAGLCSTLAARGITDVSVSGPQMEDVFLQVADEPELNSLLLPPPQFQSDDPNFEMESSRVVSFWGQVKILLSKRYVILRRFWWPYLYVLALPLIITPFFKDLLNDYKQPSCEPIMPVLYSPHVETILWDDICKEWGCDTVTLGPHSASEAMYKMVEKGYKEVADVDINDYDTLVQPVDDREGFIKYFETNYTSYTLGGVFMDAEKPVIAYRFEDFGGTTASRMINLWSQMEGGIEIIASQQNFAETRLSANNIGASYVVFFTLLHAIYPAAFVLYPAIERVRKVRALEYANGVRHLPLWVAYGIFDFFFVLAISLGSTAIMSTQLSWNGPIWIMFPILTLYGLAATLLGYIVSRFVSGPLKSFFTMMGISILMYIIAAVLFAVGSIFADAAQMDTLTLAIFFSVYIFLPVGNVFRALLIGLNVLEAGCRNNQPTMPGSIYGYGGPILYLVLQIMILFGILIWIEQGHVDLFGCCRRRRHKNHKSNKPESEEKEEDIGLSSEEVKREQVRVESTETDLLRALHLTKSFGTNKAINDISFGLPEGDVMALIGPNGAGKSTLVNLIQSELTPDRGSILLRGEDAQTRSAQKYLGVCPQNDALDLMSAKEHLSFFARVKGIKDVKRNVEHVMARLNLTPRADTLASKLSGGNKRKLSLAIALMGKPPVLVLDEPTSAMDAVAKRAFWRIVQEISPGRSLIITTHSMEEADTLATRTAILSKRLLAIGTTQALRRRYGNIYHVSLLLASAPKSTIKEMNIVRSWILAAVPGAQLEREMMGGQIRFTVPGAASPVARLITLLEREKGAMGIQYYFIGAATLESVFLSVIREKKLQEEDEEDVTEKSGFWRIFRKRW